MKLFGSTRRRKSRETMEELERRAKAGDLSSSRGESLWTVYLRRFRKHTLGKIGLLLLALLYTIAILADFLSPFDMRWTDKTKSFHPPTRIYFTYKDGGKTVFRPFVYEKYVINIPRKKYGIMPSRAIRVITIETRPGMIENRIIAL